MNDCKPEFEGKVDDGKSGFSIVENREAEVTDSETSLKRAESSEETIRRVLSSYDIGQKLDFLRANIELALDRPDLGPELADYLRRLVRERLS